MAPKDKEDASNARCCAICNIVTTDRSFNEHANTYHLGNKCYFPGVDQLLPGEDDSKMVELMTEANERMEGGQRGDKFWCFWDECGSPHHFTSLPNLKRHLRTKQKKLSLERGTSLPVKPKKVIDQVDVAWKGVLEVEAARAAKFEFLKCFILPQDGIQVCFDINAHQRLSDAITNTWATSIELGQAIHGLTTLIANDYKTLIGNDLTKMIDYGLNTNVLQPFYDLGPLSTECTNRLWIWSQDELSRVNNFGPDDVYSDPSQMWYQLDLEDINLKLKARISELWRANVHELCSTQNLPSTQ
ncbi:hypothetical protein F4819DRAFT_493040 [Hypoxylon fuscum]|nr:hypothetical protein F4819DRAFT_493040 [Hypoxylon fuscum]